MELVLHSDSDEPTAQLARQLRPGKLGVDKFWPSKFLIALLEALLGHHTGDGFRPGG